MASKKISVKENLSWSIRGAETLLQRHPSLTHRWHYEPGDQGIRLKSMRGCGGYIEGVYFENFQLSSLRMEAILLNMFYGASSAESTSQTPPVFRDIHIKNVTCGSAEAAIVVHGLPEQPIQNVTLEDLDIKSQTGISCYEATDLTLKNVSVQAQQEPVFHATNVSGLQTIDLVLNKLEKETI